MRNGLYIAIDTFPFLSLLPQKATARANSSPSRFPGAAADSLSLLRPLRRRKGGGIPDPCVRVVNRGRVSVVDGGVVVGVASSCTTFCSSRSALPLAGVVCCGDGSVEVPLAVVGATQMIAFCGDCVLGACRRRAVVFSSVGAGFLRYVGEAPDILLSGFWAREMTTFFRWCGAALLLRRRAGTKRPRSATSRLHRICLVNKVSRRLCVGAAEAARRRVPGPRRRPKRSG